MSERPSDKPLGNPSSDGAVAASRSSARKTDRYPFGLSAKQFAKVRRNMLATAKKVCRHSGASHEDAVQQAFLTALSKPIEERPSIQDEKKFIGWMCEVTKYEALTNRLYQLRQAEREVAADDEIDECSGIAPSLGAVEARKMLHRLVIALSAEEQKLLHALFLQEKTIREFAQEERRPWATVFSRRKRLLDLLYVALRATLVALALVPKRVHAFVAHLIPRAHQVLMHAHQFGGAVVLTTVCGVVLPASSSAMNEPAPQVSLTLHNALQATSVQPSGFQPSFGAEVEPEEPKAVDVETNQCSVADMQSTKFATYLRETLVPLALTMTPVLAHFGCVGTEQQTRCPPEPTKQQEDDAAARRANDAYEDACLFARARGETCLPREQWFKHGQTD